MSEGKHIDLFYKEGKSDKLYRTHLTNEKDGWYVRVEFGRRGSSLTAATKIAATTEEKAIEVFNKVIKEKTLKGYTQTEGSIPYVGGDKENKITGVLPQLLNNIDDEDLDDYLDDPEYCLQEKKDGKRILFRKSGKLVEGINRKGLLVGLPGNIVEKVQEVEYNFLLDGELIGEIYWAFDALELADTSLCGFSYYHRQKLLEKTISLLEDQDSPIRLVETSFTTQEKRKSFNNLKKQGVEGVVFKLLSAPYKPGRPSSGGDQLKYKFTNTCTCQVSGHNEKGKRSVYIQMLDGKALVDVGKVTVLPNFEVPKIGTLVEIRYLYRHVHGALYQPVFLGERDDLEKPDQIKTLKVKEGIEDDDV